MDEFSAGIQGTGGNAGEQSGERSEIEIFDFVNQKPDLTTRRGAERRTFGDRDL